MGPMSSKTIEGQPCVRCGSTARYIVGGKCVPCKKARRRAQYLRLGRPARPPALTYAQQKQRMWKRLGWPDPTRPMPSFCECCGRAPSGRHKDLCLDHDHATGKFRGWLCQNCNQAIGKLGDTHEGVMRAADYLHRASAK